jgi:hypothetical protein
MSALDVGSGSGYLTACMAHMVSRVSKTKTDFSYTLSLPNTRIRLNVTIVARCRKAVFLLG